MRALSIRQPYAELILRGIKTVEFRSRSTNIIGERFYIYASQKWAEGKLLMEGMRSSQKSEVARQKSDGGKMWSNDLAMPGDIQPWMTELAQMLILKDLPTGVIVGSAVIERVEETGEDDKVTRRQGDKVSDANPSFTLSPPHLVTPSSMYQWHLTDVQRIKRFRKPTLHPQPVWFEPF